MTFDHPEHAVAEAYAACDAEDRVYLCGVALDEVFIRTSPCLATWLKTTTRDHAVDQLGLSGWHDADVAGGACAAFSLEEAALHETVAQFARALLKCFLSELCIRARCRHLAASN